MQQHLGHQAGVQKVAVGLVDVGVSVSEMDIIAGGEILRDGATGLTSKIGPSQSFPVKPNAISKKLEEPGAVVGA